MNTAKSVRMLQAVAMFVGVALLMWSTILPAISRVAEAASISNASDTITSSVASSSVNHTIVFTTPSGMAISETFEVTFDDAFYFPALIEDDIDIDINGAASTTAAGAADGTNWGITFSGKTITFEAPSAQGGVASSSIITLRIGINAVDSGTGANQVENPAATSSYPIDIGKGASTMQDSGQVRVAIMDEVTVTAAVDTSLTFTVSGTSSGITVNGSPTTTVANTTNTTLPFGTLPVGTSRTLAQDLSVATNAANGFSVTVEQSLALQTSVGNTIDGFIDGSDTVTPTAWQDPGALISDADTYGHWGITSTDFVTERTSEFSSDTWVAPSTTPIVVMGHTSSADGTTDGEGRTTVGYQIQISALQEAGDDYSTTLRYIATPTF